MPYQNKTIKVTSNVELLWSIIAVAEVFGMSRDTVTRRLEAMEERPDTEGFYRTRQLIRSLFPDKSAEQLRRITAEANLLETKNKILTGEYLNKAALLDALTPIVGAIKDAIESSQVSAEAKREVLQSLADINPALYRVQRAQTSLEADEVLDPTVGPNPAKTKAKRKEAE